MGSSAGEQAELDEGQTTEPERLNVQTFKRANALLGRVTKLPTWLNFWVPLAASALSLAVALYTLIIATQDPEMVLILPNQVHFSEAANIGTDYRPSTVYLQPSFVSTGNNDRTELIKGLILSIAATDGSAPLVLEWQDQGKWDLTESLAGLVRSYTYQADAAPMLVSPNQAQQPLSAFAITREWVLHPDTTYRLTLTANRAVASTPLVGEAQMRVSAELLDNMKRQTVYTILSVPIEPALR